MAQQRYHHRAPPPKEVLSLLRHASDDFKRVPNQALCTAVADLRASYAALSAKVK